jgi:putative ABC transport system permease protein
MIQNYLKIAWRNLSRHKLHSVINITGLVIGFTIGLVILLTVYSQFKFDRFHKNSDRLFQAYEVFNEKKGESISSTFGYPAGPLFKSEIPSIEKTTRFLYGGSNIIYGEKELDIPVMLVDEDFLSMFSFPISKGNKNNPLASLNGIVLTQKTAVKIFGNADPIGKTISIVLGNQPFALSVTAVTEDHPKESSIRFEALARIENRPDYARDRNNWNFQHHPVFVQLKKGSTVEQAEKEFRQFNRKHLADWFEGMKKDGAKPDKNGDEFSTHLLSFSDMHFSPEINNAAINKAQVYIILSVGLFIILIACFNFININLANAFTRSREIGVRKCLGAEKGKLFAQFWGESFLICLISFLISMALVKLFIYSLSRMIEMEIPPGNFTEPGFILLSVALLFIVSLIAGGYPSLLMSKFKVSETLKGKVSLQQRSLLRNSLIVVQFVIACVMISCTFIIYQQFKYLQKADLGINKDYVVSIPIYKNSRGKEIVDKLRSRLSSNPNVLSVTASTVNIGRGNDGSTSKHTTGFEYKGKPISTNIAAVDYDYLKTLGLKITEGRDFDKAYPTDTMYNVLVSASAASQFGEKNIIGTKAIPDSSAPAWNIIGVFPDFHLYSLHESREPLTLVLNRSNGYNYCFVKIAPQNVLNTMNQLKSEMALLEPGKEFKGSFLDDNINNWYAQERLMAILFSIAAFIAIVLSLTGLFAMALLIIRQRVKEIGIRKVLGATVQNISVMVSKDFLMLVGIAVMIATPLAWLAMNKWLQEFPYRIEIKWWMFGLVGILALILSVLTIGFNTVRAALQNPVKSLRTE